MKIYLGPWSINIKFYWVIPTFVAMALFYHLGTWQIQRYDEKKNWLATQTEQDITGKFLPQFRVYLDNKIVNHVPGYEVFEAFEINQASPATQIVLISRGWIAQPKNTQGHHHRDNLPPIPGSASDSSQKIKLSSIQVNRSKSKFGVTHLETQTHSDHTNIRASRLDLQDIGEVLKKQFPSADFVSTYTFALEKESEYQLTPLPEPKNWINPNKHLGYALQWFLFCLITLFLFLRFGVHLIKTPIKKSSTLCG